MAAREEDIKLGHYLDDFERSFEEQDPNPGTSLRTIISSMPSLQDSLTDAIRDGGFAGFKASQDRRVAGDYDPTDKCIYISAEKLIAAQRSEVEANSIRYTLAHETCHARDFGLIDRQEEELAASTKQMIASGGDRNYTDVLRTYERRSQDIEISAEMAGFNAFVDYVRSNKPNATLLDIHDASPNDARMFVDVRNGVRGRSASPKGELELDGQMHINDTQGNREWMREHYYKRNQYAKNEIARGIDTILRIEGEEAPTIAKADGGVSAVPRIGAHLRQLGVNMKLPEGFTNLGMSKRSSREEHSDTTAEPSQRGPEPKASKATASAAPLTPDNAGHPDYSFYKYLRELIPKEIPNDAVAHAMLVAKSNGIHDASYVASVGLTNKRDQIAIGGNLSSGEARAMLRLDEVRPMAAVAAELEAQRARQAQPSFGGDALSQASLSKGPSQPPPKQ